MKPTITSALVLCLLLLAACGDDDGGTTNPTPDAGADAAPDTSEEGDASEDAPSDVGDEDTGAEDVGADAEADVVEDTTPDVYEPPPCPEPPTGEAPPLGRWSLSMFHFNIQYVAGGIEGFAETTIGIDLSDVETDEIESEDRIITESFLPILDILERNPDLALTVEMQGLMLEIMAERFPQDVDRMRVLANAGQLEIASIHYSDQFFLAFGVEDMDESWRLTQKVFDDNDMPLSRVVFTQEGQFGEGFAEWLASRRPDAIMVMARNIVNFHQQGLASAPYWKVGDLDVVVPRGHSGPQVERGFSFFDDGELMATNDSNPYFGTLFARHEPSILDYEKRLQCAHEAGTHVATVTEYLDTVKAAETEDPPEMAPFLDCTWQPKTTRGPFRWMGGEGDVWGDNEADNTVLNTCIAARHQVLALHTVRTELGDDAPAGLVSASQESWRSLLLGEVSDARGVNPWWGEIQYGLMHCGDADTTARNALQAELARREVTSLEIDCATGDIVENPPITDELARVEVDAPLDMIVTHGEERSPTVTWTLPEGQSAGPGVPYQVDIEWPVLPDAVTTQETCLTERGEARHCLVDPAHVGVSFPRVPGQIIYRPALTDRIVQYSESQFAPQQEAFEDAMWTTGADGLLGLGDDLYVVKDVTNTHLAFGFPPGEDRNAVVWVKDETLQPYTAAHWRFWVTSDLNTAEMLALRNMNPVIRVE